MPSKKQASLSTALLRWAMVIAFLGGLVAVVQPGQNAAATQVGTAQNPSEAIFRGVSTAVQFDVSRVLRSLPPLEVKPGSVADIPERPSGLEGALGPQDVDPLVQASIGALAIPSPLISFDGPSNIAGVAPPDPVGDVGPNHYVAMSNLYFQVFDKTGVSLYGPAANNTLWAGFGGDCETNNAGDPIVIYDQLDDRWILSQFTSSGPIYYNCVAISTSPDPTSTYYRYAFSTGANFPDYPKYGMWSDALYISTREFAGSSFAGIGAYAVNRSQLVAGNPAAQVISFLIPPGATPYNVGDGLLPTDLDGMTLPPPGSPNFFMGSMDDGGPYGAPQDALTLWKFHADFAVPANSSFTQSPSIPVAAFDSIYPCSPGSRDCIPQPGTSNKIDILSYRQRPMWRLAYRNFGDHEALVTNQSVEAAPTIAGIRWYEIRDPNGTPTIYQQGTYAPGLVDGIHRWMGSIAMDSAGNMALGYSASDATSTFPSSWYTGRLATDPLGTLPQGEGSIINGTGSQTGSQRWGDYTSMNVDPVDDCTFWYVNEYVPTTSASGWRLRIGAFKFSQCGTPDFTLNAAPASQAICTPDDAVYTVDVGSVSGYSDLVTLSAIGNPAGTTTSFSVNPAPAPYTSSLTIGNTGAAAAGSYSIDIVGIAPTSTHTTTVGLDVYTAVPLAPTLLTPANGAGNVPVQPTFTWTGNGASYTIEIATDAGFTNIVASAGGIIGTSYNGAILNNGDTYFWRVQADNACGTGPYSSAFIFTVESGPGECGPGTAANILYSTDFESGVGGWTHTGTGDTWALSGANPHSGSNAFHADDPASVSDQQLVSPPVLLPTGENPVTLQFWNWQHMETRAGGCFDGSILEVSDDGGTTWNQVLDADLLTDPYDGPVSASYSNPLADLNAWCGDNPQPYLNSIADVSAYAGQTVQFRFRLGSDTSVSRPGWDIDDVVVQSCASVGDPDILMDPLSVDDAQSPELQTMHPITITNIGQADLIWTIGEAALVKDPAEGQPSLPSARSDPASVREDAVSSDANSTAQGPFPVSTYEQPQAVLYDNGPLVNCPGCGAGGADESALQNVSLGMNTYGFGHQVSALNRVADDFTISDPNGWYITGITFFAYQTNSLITSTITAVNLQIWDGPPDDPGSTVVWGDTATNRLSNTTWSGIYRTSENTTGSTGRPIMADRAAVSVFLPPGTYWLDWQTDGTLASGPWAPPITINGQATTGNALQFTSSGWAAALDSGTGTPQQGFPFIIEGIITVCSAPSDIPWLSVNPLGGMTSAGVSSVVTMTLDSTGMTTGVYTGTVCVNSNDPDLPIVEVPVTMTVMMPEISLVKTVGTDPEVCAATDTITVTEGSDVTYCYQVTNTGSITLPLHDLDDSVLGNIFTGLSYSLSPGASVFVTQTMNITQTTVNTATWTAYNAGPSFVATATASATVNTVPRNPGIAITKTVGTDPGVCATSDSITVPAGTMVYYCVTVTNTGNVSLSLHDLEDDQLGTIFSGLAYDLAPGASVNTVAAGVTISAVASTTTVNMATWTAYNPGPSDAATATASATVNALPTLFLPIIFH